MTHNLKLNILTSDAQSTLKLKEAPIDLISLSNSILNAVKDNTALSTKSSSNVEGIAQAGKLSFRFKQVKQEN